MRALPGTTVPTTARNIVAMEISPQTIRSTGFKTVKKGYDPAEVDAFREQVAAAVELSQNQATAMEARARAAVAKLQEVSQQVSGAGREERPAAVPSGDTEVISRTLLLAQRTADATVADARIEAEHLVGQAREEAGRVLDSARSMASKTVDDAKVDARRSAEDERIRADNEVQSLLARRDFLLADVDHLEQYLQAQRERLRDAAVQLQELVERVPGGLGEMRRPLLSASAEPLPAAFAPLAPPTLDSAPASPAEPAAEGESAASTAEVHPDNEPPARLDATTLATNPGATDSVWRMLDEEVAGTASPQPSLDLPSDVTSEVPAAPLPDDPFRIGGEELH